MSSPACSVSSMRLASFAKGWPAHSRTMKGQESNHSFPLSIYSAPGDLRQDPGRAAESLAEARTYGNGGCEMRVFVIDVWVAPGRRTAGRTRGAVASTRSGGTGVPSVRSGCRRRTKPPPPGAPQVVVTPAGGPTILGRPGGRPGHRHSTRRSDSDHRAPVGRAQDHSALRDQPRKTPGTA